MKAKEWPEYFEPKKTEAMKNNTDTAKAFLRTNNAAWWADNSSIPDLLVDYHSHLMSEAEKEQPKELNTFSTIPFAFVMWYSGMKSEQIINAFNRWENEEGQFKD